MEINSNWFCRDGPEKSSPKIRPAIFGSGSLGFRIWEVKDRSYGSQTSTEAFHEKGLLFPKKTTGFGGWTKGPETLSMGFVGVEKLVSYVGIIWNQY